MSAVQESGQRPAVWFVPPSGGSTPLGRELCLSVSRNGRLEGTQFTKIGRLSSIVRSVIPAEVDGWEGEVRQVASEELARGRRRSRRDPSGARRGAGCDIIQLSFSVMSVDGATTLVAGGELSAVLEQGGLLQAMVPCSDFTMGEGWGLPAVEPVDSPRDLPLLVGEGALSVQLIDKVTELCGTPPGSLGDLLEPGWPRSTLSRLGGQRWSGAVKATGSWERRLERDDCPAFVREGRRSGWASSASSTDGRSQVARRPPIGGSLCIHRLTGIESRSSRWQGRLSACTSRRPRIRIRTGKIVHR
ncbi:MAG: hypothetical protein SGPRY_006798 [Prymnesium sp.]